MPDAIVGANSQVLPEATDRRAVLGAVLAAGAVAALPPTSAAAVSPALSAVDRRVLDLWRRRGKLKSLIDRLSEQYAAARDKLPEWARDGEVYFRPDGSPAGMDASSGWPMVADLSRRPIEANGLVNARPSPDDLRAEFRKAAAEEERGAAVELELALAEHAERQGQQKTERERLGVDVLGERCDAAIQAFCAVEVKLDEYLGASVLGLAAVIMGLIHGEFGEDIDGLHRATLAAIRPQLVGAIAEDADRILAQAEEPDR